MSSWPSRDWYHARFLLRVCLSEMFAVSALIFTHMHYDATVPYNLPEAIPCSIVFGWAIWIFGPISGPQLSPIVTVSLLVTRRITIFHLLASMIGQFLGVLFGFLLALGLAANTHPFLNTPKFGMSTVNHVTAAQAFGLEFLASTWLIWVILATLDEFRAVPWSQGHVSIFYSVFLLTRLWLEAMLHLRTTWTDNSYWMSGVRRIFYSDKQKGSYTGCSLNPFRSLVPAVFHRKYDNLWVYIVGPFAAAILAPLIYETVFSDGASTWRFRAWFTLVDFDRYLDYKLENTKDNATSSSERFIQSEE
ncbi:aquaporin-1 [Paragonimus westermani]|uniref:Aquaporin-1 n=1 Tax=Paragonimus westermani TaxID=34504 RepID=A0A5J4NVK7_9TREM|nr:aquaporin-1 [Paragonimus westermani]